MIKVNGKEYDVKKTDISWGEFTVSCHGKTRKGQAPFISFHLDNNILIGLEFTFSKEMFEESKVNIRVNCDDYLSDITYEDDGGWFSLILEKYNCYITRIDSKTFNVELTISGTDNINLEIIQNVQILNM